MQRLLRLTQPNSDWLPAPEKRKKSKAENVNVLPSAFSGEMQSNSDSKPRFDNPAYDVADSSQVSAEVP